ncbi:MAG: hypothetical protein M4D80_10530 [Myxococcota bacterium]|nr:hypothetical protein [Deltaproteobacteria bacterium]MDQ3335591.1 hypothetical protein [Myxococcota bacterium]
MRLVLALFVVAACGGKPSPAPAWPKTADKEVDGGESLEPRAKAASVVAATKKDDEVVVVAPVVEKDKPAAPKTDAETPKPATPTGTTPVTEELIITTEEIVIEIDE